MWRAYVGSWGEPGRAWLDGRELTWAQARERLRAWARDYSPDECVKCWETAQEALDELDALADGAEWWGELEGEDLLLIPERGSDTALAQRQRAIDALYAPLR